MNTKTRILIAASTLICVTALAQAAATLTHRYEFNGNVNDSVGTANATSTTTWAPSQSAAPTYASITPSGIVGGASSTSIQLGKTPDTFSLFALPSSVITDAGSISLWFQYDLTAADSTEDYILNLSDDWNRGIKLLVAKNSSNLSARVEDKTLGSSAITKDSWYHIAITWDKSAGSASFYVNGTLIATESFTGSTLVAGGLNVGNYKTGTSYLATQFAGSIYDLQIYSGQLAADEVSRLAASPGSVSAIPEPANVVLLVGIAALGTLGFIRRRCRI